MLLVRYRNGLHRTFKKGSGKIPLVDIDRNVRYQIALVEADGRELEAILEIAPYLKESDCWDGCEAHAAILAFNFTEAKVVIKEPLSFENKTALDI